MDNGQVLADELTAISQYMVHSEMCDNWDYDKLHQAIEKHARAEMQRTQIEPMGLANYLANQTAGAA
jgi:bacterioferritin (cytochrome b1)